MAIRITIAVGAFGEGKATKFAPKKCPFLSNVEAWCEYEGTGKLASAKTSQDNRQQTFVIRFVFHSVDYLGDRSILATRKIKLKDLRM